MEVECGLYVMDQAQCEANGCVYVTELDGEVSCEEPELEAGEVAEPDEEAVEDAAELAEEQNELQNGEEAAEAGKKKDFLSLKKL